MLLLIIALPLTFFIGVKIGFFVGHKLGYHQGFGAVKAREHMLYEYRKLNEMMKKKES